MNKTELLTMLNNFKKNGISHDKKRLQEVLDFQDIIGRSSFNDILESYAAMDHTEKGTFLWATCTCLAKDTFLEIIKKVVCQSIITDHEIDMVESYRASLIHIEKREEKMNNLEKQNAVITERIKTLELRLSNSQKESNALKTKAQSFDTIKSLLR